MCEWRKWRKWRKWRDDSEEAPKRCHAACGRAGRLPWAHGLCQRRVALWLGSQPAVRAPRCACARPGCAQVTAASRLEATPCGGSVQLGAGLVDTGRCHDRCATTGLACADGKLRTAGHELGAPRNGVIGAAPTTRRRSQGCVSLSGRDVFETVLAGLRVAWVGMLYLSISRSLDTERF